jgi:hypothetical protein
MTVANIDARMACDGGQDFDTAAIGLRFDLVIE